MRCTNAVRRMVLSLGLLACAGMAAFPPGLESQVQIPQEEWHELFAAPSETAWGRDCSK